jgi:hypothetical protein
MVFLEDDGRKCRAVDKPKVTFGGSGMKLRAELYWAGMSEDLVICEGAESALAAAILFERPAVEYWA